MDKFDKSKPVEATIEDAVEDVDKSSNIRAERDTKRNELKATSRHKLEEKYAKILEFVKNTEDGKGTDGSKRVASDPYELSAAKKLLKSKGL